MEPALATACIVAAALTDTSVPLAWRPSLVQILCALCFGEQDDVAEACREVVRGCVWSLYEEIASGRSSAAAAYAFELLMAFPGERERLVFFQGRFRDNLPLDLWSENLDVNSIDF